MVNAAGIRPVLLALLVTLLLAGLEPPASARADEARPPRTPRRPTPRLPWTNARCGSCHLPEAIFSHPVDVVPSIPVPPDLPLVNGAIACTTCHDGDAADDHARARTEHRPLLRGGDGGSDFCGRCHDEGSGRAVDMHAMSAGLAHLRWTSGRPRRRRDRPPAAGGDSNRCVRCHDGTVARDVAGGSHPFGVVYDARGPAVSGLRPARTLDPRLRLFDGRVECGSCHGLFAPGATRLVMPTGPDGLCVACHEP